MLKTVLEISLSTGAVILAALAAVPFLEKRYRAKGRYVLWLILAVRLLIPFNFTLPKAPLTIKPPEGEPSVVLRTDNSIYFTVMDKNEAYERAQYEVSSANYAPLFTLEELFTWIWLWGAVIFLGCHIFSYLRFRLKIRKDLVYTGDYKGLKYYVSPHMESPILVGFFRPAVIMPEGECSDEEREIILMHEYTHYKRGDLWYKLLLLAANSVHWFNPAVYFMLRRAMRDLEYSCDDIVVTEKDLEFRRRYSMTILKTMKRKSGLKEENA